MKKMKRASELQDNIRCSDVLVIETLLRGYGWAERIFEN